MCIKLTDGLSLLCFCTEQDSEPFLESCIAAGFSVLPGRTPRKVGSQVKSLFTCYDSGDVAALEGWMASNNPAFQTHRNYKKQTVRVSATT